jgi:hypothetical protein
VIRSSAEVCYAKTGLIICGTKSVAAHIFALAPGLLDLISEAHCKAVLGKFSNQSFSYLAFHRYSRIVFTLNDYEATFMIMLLQPLNQFKSDNKR